MTNNGIYYLVNKNTAKEDIIPAETTAKLSTKIFVVGAPQQHLGVDIENPNILEISRLYLKYLKSIVEEWTGILNNIS